MQKDPFKTPARDSMSLIQSCIADKFYPENGDSWGEYLSQSIHLRNMSENEIARFGIERCLYEMNPNLVCLSPYLINSRVLTAEDAIKALEIVAAQPNRPNFPIDRHLAAFLMSRWKDVKFIDICDLNKPQREIKNRAALRILAGIQDQYKIKHLENLCQWLADLCAPIATNYRNLKARAQAQEDVAKAVSSGQLSKLIKGLNHRVNFSEDASDFQAARIEMLLIESEIKEIEARITNRNGVHLKQTPETRSKFYGWVCQAFSHIKSYQGKKRIRQLYKTSEYLRETWGESIVPTGKSKKYDFWKRFLARTNLN